MDALNNNHVDIVLGGAMQREGSALECARLMSDGGVTLSDDNNNVTSDEEEEGDTGESGAEEDVLGSSTSVSVDSFDMSPQTDVGLSTVVEGEEEEVDSAHDSPNTASLESQTRTVRRGCKSDSGRESSPTSTSTHANIAEEMSKLDTAMPHFDFSKLEAKLNEEREIHKRKSFRESVRRRLAEGDDDDDGEENNEQCAAYFGPDYTSSNQGAGRQKRPSLTQRLKASKELEVCYVNDCSPSTSAEVLSDAGNEPRTIDGRSADLEELLRKAREEAAAHVSMERRAARSPDGGPPTAGKPKLCRARLSKTDVAQLRFMVNEMNDKFERLNEQLVALLLERDALHMEQDSKLVDVEDLLRNGAPSDVPSANVVVVVPVSPSKSKRFSQLFHRS